MATHGILLDEEGMALVFVRATLLCIICGMAGGVVLHGRPAVYHADGMLYYEVPVACTCTNCGAPYQGLRQGIHCTLSHTYHHIVPWTEVRDDELRRRAGEDARSWYFPNGRRPGVLP